MPALISVCMGAVFCVQRMSFKDEHSKSTNSRKQKKKKKKKENEVILWFASIKGEF